MKSFIITKHRKLIGGMAACAVLATTGLATAADSPAADPNRQGSGAARLSGNTDDASARTADKKDLAGITDKKDAMAMPKDAKSFVKDALAGNAAEVALAQVAERKAQNEQVKQYAQMIRQDHNQANQQLQSLAQKHGLSASTPLDEKHQKTLDRLQTLNGAEFDREYAKEMLKDHHKTIAKYEHASRNVSDSEIQQYVQTTLPKLRQHLQHAKTTAQAVGVDQATISSMTKEMEPMGGTADESSSHHDSHKSDDKKD